MYLKIGNIPRIIIALGKIFPYICCAFRGNDILKKSAFLVEIAKLSMNTQARVNLHIMWVVRLCVFKAFGDA